MRVINLPTRLKLGAIIQLDGERYKVVGRWAHVEKPAKPGQSRNDARVTGWGYSCEPINREELDRIVSEEKERSA